MSLDRSTEITTLRRKALVPEETDWSALRKGRRLVPFYMRLRGRPMSVAGSTLRFYFGVFR